jgi:hypothetical protein
VTGFWAQLVGPKVAAVLGLGCLGFGGLMIALHFSGQKLPPAPSRAELQEVRGRVVVVAATDSGLYNHPSSRMLNALEGWQVVLAPEGDAEPITLRLGDGPPFGSSRSLDLSHVERLLPRGAFVIAQVHGGPWVWHLERDGQVLVDFEERRAAHERRASRDVWLMSLLPLLGLALCGRALFARRHGPPTAEGELGTRASEQGKA